MKKMTIDSMVRNAVKRVVPFCLFAFLPLAVSAQTTVSAPTTTESTPLRYGYMSYDSVLHGMAEYAAVETSMTQLAEKYTAEQQRAENEFNLKYEEFLDSQRDMPQSILQKRQSELQELLDRNIAFKKESQKLLEKARTEAEAPLRQRIAEAMGNVGMERGLLFIVNTDSQPLAWTHPVLAVDVTSAVQAALR